MTMMTVSEAMLSRMSCRAFLDTPVPARTVRELLETARHSPSGGNLQPWRVFAIAGEPLQQLRALVRGKLATHPRGEGSEYNIYPSDLAEPYRSRRFKCGEDLYATLGVTRADRPARLAQFARNYDFYGAPTALFFALDRQMGPPQWSDVGMFMQSVMLLARERGLHTCAQESWSVWQRVVAEFLDFPRELMLFCAMAIGYRDEGAPINRLQTDRAELAEFARFRGFDWE